VSARQVGCTPGAEQVLRSAYRAFNVRDVEAAIALMRVSSRFGGEGPVAMRA
jgi:hypothetical protein